MKKIMLVVAAIATGLVTQASTVSWTVSGVKGSDGAALDAGHVYIFAVAGDVKADVSSWDALAGKGTSALKSAVAGANVDYALTGAAGNFSSEKYTLPVYGVEAGTKYSCYAVLFDTAEITAESKYFVTAATTATTTLGAGSSLNKAYSLSSVASATASNWKAVGGTTPGPTPGDVPEPTSAMLLALGAAGLALRRRRA